MFHVPAHKNVAHPAGQVTNAILLSANNRIEAIDKTKWPAVAVWIPVANGLVDDAAMIAAVHNCPMDEDEPPVTAEEEEAFARLNKYGVHDYEAPGLAAYTNCGFPD